MARTEELETDELPHGRGCSSAWSSLSLFRRVQKSGVETESRDERLIRVVYTVAGVETRVE